MKTLMAAIHQDGLEEEIFETSCQMAHALQAKLWLIEVTPPEPDFVGLDSGPQSERDALAAELASRHKDLLGLATKARQNSIDAHAVMAKGSTVETLIAEAQKHQVDLLVVGNSQHSWFYQAFLGSSATSLIHKSPIPVLLIPPKTAKK